MAEKRKIGSSWQALTGTGPYYKEDSAISRLFSGEPNIFGRRAKKEMPPEVSVTAKKRSVPAVAASKGSPSEVGVTARKRPNPVAVDEVPAKAAAKPAPKPAPKAAAKPKVDRMKDFMADLESKNPDNEVFKRLRARGFAKGGHVKADGCAKKGKTRGRII